MKKFFSKNEVWKEIKETLSASSIHSFPNIVQNRFKSIKFVWAICFLVSTVACAFFITTTLSEYLEFDSVSKWTVKYSQKIDFPIISICDLNVFKTSYATEFMTSYFNLNLSDFDSTKTFTNSKIDFLNKRYSFLEIAKGQNETIRKMFGKSLDHILYSCMFNMVECDLNQDFEYYYDIYYGNCYRYNSGRNMNGDTTERKQISTNGILNGFQIELFIGKLDDSDDLFSINNGINLFIESERVESQSAEGIRISPGTKTFISLSKYSMSHLPKPYSDCTAGLNQLESSDNIYYRNLISKNQSYTEPLCRFNCFQKYLGDMCECQELFTVKFYQDLPLCYQNANKSICLYNAFTNFSNLDLFENCNCPVRCENSFYTYKLSYSEYPTKFYAKFMSKNKNLTRKYNFSDEFNFDDYKNKLAEINIFYDELKETIVEHHPKISQVDLISNIGGTLGHFISL